MLVNNEVNYIDEVTIMNAQSSYDPSDTKAILAFNWTCPEILLEKFNCS